MYLYEKGLLIMISQNMVIKIFDKSEMQRLRTAFKTEIKKKKKKKQAKRLLINNQSFHRSSVNLSNNQPGVQPRNEKFTEFKNRAVVSFEKIVDIHLPQLSLETKESITTFFWRISCNYINRLIWVQVNDYEPFPSSFTSRGISRRYVIVWVEHTPVEHSTRSLLESFCRYCDRLLWCEERRHITWPIRISWNVFLHVYIFWGLTRGRNNFRRSTFELSLIKSMLRHTQLLYEPIALVRSPLFCHNHLAKTLWHVQ